MCELQCTLIVCVFMILYATIYDFIQALEYLLWASISLELSIPLMTAKYLPSIVTLYCAVCHCYYDNQDAVQAEVKHSLPASSQTDKHPMSTKFSHILSYECKLLLILSLTAFFSSSHCQQSIEC